jgi:hypothetical protein
MGQERSMGSQLLEKVKRRRTIPIDSKHIVLKPGAYENQRNPKKEVMKEGQEMVIEWLESETREL